jgi:hypothetical protein
MMLEEIATHLNNLSLGIYDPEGTDGDIFLMGYPDSKIRCITLYQYSGRPPEFLDTIEHPGLQITCRDTDGLNALSRLEQITRALDQSSPTISETYYPYIRAKQSPFFLKNDENGNPIYAVNFDISRRFIKE